MFHLEYFDWGFTSKAGLRTPLVEVYVRCLEYYIALFDVTIMPSECRRINSLDNV